MSDIVRYPAPGCIVEYLEGNVQQTAFVMEAAGGRVRLLLPNRRETRLPESRLLPWAGPQYSADAGRDEAVALMAKHVEKRRAIAESVPVLDVWEMAQGEVESAPAGWFAELFETDPDADHVAAYGRALLQCKTHFRFQPPEFLVFSAEERDKRMAAQKAREEREALIAGGTNFFHILWEVACGRRSLPVPGGPGAGDLPTPEVACRLKELLKKRMINPEDQETAPLWTMLSKGLPEVPHVPLQLLTAWGELPPHYDFWFDRADYAPGDDWWREESETVEKLAKATADPAALGMAQLPACGLPFLSIDSATTRDVDDAFHVEARGDGFIMTIALACPALCWPFGSPLDGLVLHRGTSVYLPEQTCHMMPECLGTDAWSLRQGEERPALCVRIPIDGGGGMSACEISLARVRLAANLNYEDCEAVLAQVPTEENPAAAHALMLKLALEAARRRLAARIADGAVVMDRPEPHVTLEGEGRDTRVSISPAVPTPEAMLLVSEGMIAASAAVALWAAERAIPMLHRTQPVTLPPEYAGVWTTPQDMTRVMRALVPSQLETQARPHAALGLKDYTPLTSPLRRYPDLVNMAQVVSFLREGVPRFSKDEIEGILHTLAPVLDAVGQVQRFRPRYWKLLFFRQQGDKMWWRGVITEVNEIFVSVSLPDQGMFVRGKRRMFDERACPGMPVSVRIGRVQPLWNEIQILEAAVE